MRTMDDAFRASIAIDARLHKASFGGDRSAAGRYAAEQRWKGHVKGDISQKVTLGFEPRGYKNDSGTVYATDKETGKVIGALSFDGYFIGKVYVLPEYRRKGVAKYLYEEAKKRNGGLEMRADDYTVAGAAFMSAVTGKEIYQSGDQSQFSWKPWLERLENDAMNKASFGGDRSAAGRYAAEQRWKGHVKPEPQSDDASMRLKTEFESEQDKIPNSPPNPKGLKAIALKNWVDGPFRRDHPRNVLINDMIRHIANGLVGLPLPRFRGIRFRQGDNYIPPETFVERTKNLLESIDQAEPKQPVLWRGLRGSWDGKTGAESQQQQQILGLQVGDSFVSPIFSSSRDKEVAKMYASLHVKPESQPSVVLKIEAGAKGLRTRVIPMDAEVLTGGKFQVTARTESTIPQMDYRDINNPRPFQHKVIVISVKQVDTFGAEDYTNPSFRPDDSYRTETRL